MYNEQHHIISKISWETKLDEQGWAVELQNRISDWTNLRMPSETARAFAELCPPGQHWKIDKLELDMGEIDIDDLEEVLTHSLIALLTEKIGDEIRFANTNPNITITNAALSRVDILNSFLLHGVFPWNYKDTGDSINEMLRQQFAENYADTIQWLARTGTVSETVRRRMAWQFSEANLLHLIKGLEPNNHDQIMVFSAQMIKIQEKETIVQTGLSEFKQNLWFWILNYLYAERGSVFNRVAFMKSSISQMADHYNIEFEELLFMISEAVATVNARSYLKPDFIVVMDILISQENARRQQMMHPSSVTGEWQLLEALLHRKKISGYSRGMFNDLVMRLFRQDKETLHWLVISPAITQEKWRSIAAELTDASLEKILSLLDGVHWRNISGCISFIRSLTTAKRLAINREAAWALGIVFMRRRKGIAAETEAFLRLCIETIAATRGMQTDQAVVQLACAGDDAVAKNAAAAGIQEMLTNLLSRQTDTVLGNNFEESLRRIARQLSKGIPDRNRFEELRISIQNCLYAQPEACFVILRGQKDHNLLRKLLPFLITPRIAARMMETSHANPYKELLGIFGKIPATPHGIWQSGMPEIAVRAMLLHRDKHNFLDEIVTELSALLSPAQWKSFAANLQLLAAKGEAGTHGISVLAGNPSLHFVALAAKLITADPSHKKVAATLLLAGFDEVGFVQFRRSGDSRQAQRLMEQLMPGAADLYETLTLQYLNVLPKAVQNASLDCMRDLFWKSLLGCCRQDSSLKQLATDFYTAVRYVFAASLPLRMRVSKSSFNTNAQLPAPRGDIFLLVNSCLQTGSTSVAYRDTILQLEELISLAMDIDPVQLYRVISAVPVNSKSLAVLSASLSFSQFSFIAGSIPVTRQAVYDIESLYRFVSELFENRMPADVAIFYWKQVWRLIRTGNWSMQELVALVRRSFSLQMPFSEAMRRHLHNTLCKHSYCLTPAVRAVLAANIPLQINNIPDTPSSAYAVKIRTWQGRGILQTVLTTLILHRQIPAWLEHDIQDTAILLNEIAVHQPVVFISILRKQTLTEQQLLWLTATLHFDKLIVSAGRVARNRQTLLQLTASLYAALGHVVINGISSADIQEILFRKMLKVLGTNNWDLLSSKHIWQELLWELCARRHLPAKEMIMAIGRCRHLFPPALQSSFSVVSKQYLAASLDVTGGNAIQPARQKAKHPHKKPTETQLRNGILVKNAGLVILNSYIPMLFDRLGLTREKKFLDTIAQDDAVHYLQYLATGMEETEEGFLALNKLLCGISLEEVVSGGIHVTEEERLIMEGMINAAISHWPAAGSTTLNGFRGNWLLRNGILAEGEDYWELTVERKPYDLLFNHSPFSFSFIKYAWMDKPLHVKWPY